MTPQFMLTCVIRPNFPLLAIILFSPPEGTWLACLDGLIPCLTTSVSQNQKNGVRPEFFILIKMISHLVYYHSEEFFHLWDQSTSTGDSTSLSHSHREPISAATSLSYFALELCEWGQVFLPLFFLTLGTQN